MNIYRGPSSKEFGDNSHELVAQKPLTDIHPWHDRTEVRVNISKEPNERQSVAHIQFSESDAVVLYQRLLEGLLRRSNQLETLELKHRELQAAMREISGEATYAQEHEYAVVLARIKDAADAAVEAYGSGR